MNDEEYLEFLEQILGLFRDQECEDLEERRPIEMILALL